MSTATMVGADQAARLVGTCEAARIVGVHRNTIGHWAANGILPARVLPTGARRFDRDDVERVRAQIQLRSSAAACRQNTIAVDERPILVRVQRGGIHIGERELRYQLERKDDHPLARADELLDVLAEIEARGLIEAELCFRLTKEGRARLAQPDSDGRAGR